MVDGKNLCVGENWMLVIGDSGGCNITQYSDEEAIEFFLDWLHDERARQARQYEIERRKASIKLVDS